MIFTREKFERFARRCPAQWRADALESALVANEITVELTPEVFEQLRLKYFPEHKKPRLAAPFGLGDAVAAVAEPIAALSDKFLGTHIVGCGSCSERRAALNRLVPDVTGSKPPPP